MPRTESRIGAAWRQTYAGKIAALARRIYTDARADAALCRNCRKGPRVLAGGFCSAECIEDFESRDAW